MSSHHVATGHRMSDVDDDMSPVLWHSLESTLPLNREPVVIDDDDQSSPESELSPAVVVPRMSLGITQELQPSSSSSSSPLPSSPSRPTTTKSSTAVKTTRTVFEFTYSAALLAQKPALVKSDNKSPVWNHWASQIDDATKVHCLRCRDLGQLPTIKTRNDSNTSNLWSHLREHSILPPPKKPTDDDDAKITVTNTGTKRRKRDSSADSNQPTLDSMRGVKADRLGPAHQRESWKLLFDAMIHNYWSINSLTQDLFTRYVEFISNNRYTTPSRYQLTKMIFETVTTLREQLLSVVSDQPYISLTTDASDCNGKSYICVTANFITAKWEMVDMCLSVSEVSKSHTHDVICSLLLDCVNLWKANKSIQTIVTDNGVNFLAGVKDFIGRADARQTVCDNLRCACHTLHLCVYHALVFPPKRKSKKQINSDRVPIPKPNPKPIPILATPLHVTKKKILVALISRCRNVITKIKNSKTNLAPALALKLIQDRTETSVRKVKCRQLLSDNVTRWNSTLNMIKSLIPQLKEVNDVLTEDAQQRLCFTENDELILNELVLLLAPLETATKLLEGGKTVTISLCYGLIYWLINIFNCIDTDVFDLTTITSDIVQNARDTILAQLKTRFTSVSSGHLTTNIYALATLLDPRTKLMLSIPTAVQDLFRKTLTSSYNNLKRELNTGPITINEKKPTIAVSLCQSAFGRPSSHNTRATDELKQYMLEPIIELSECPLQWWKTNESKFPTLRHLARKFLGIPASSASSERMWSISGLLVTTHRNRMKSDNITHLMFIKQNSKVVRQLDLELDIEKIMSTVSADPNEKPVDNV
jgi:hypothetical protein